MTETIEITHDGHTPREEETTKRFRKRGKHTSLLSPIEPRAVPRGITLSRTNFEKTTTHKPSYRYALEIRLLISTERNFGAVNNFKGMRWDQIESTTTVASRAA